VEEINKQIEVTKKQKQEVDAKIAQISDLMKNLNLQATARARVNLKRGEKKRKEEELNKL
jgi:hypothetical protein